MGEEKEMPGMEPRFVIQAMRWMDMPFTGTVLSKRGS